MKELKLYFGADVVLRMPQRPPLDCIRLLLASEWPAEIPGNYFRFMENYFQKTSKQLEVVSGHSVGHSEAHGGVI